MKQSNTLNDALAGMTQVETKGDLRRIVSNSLLALARKEISQDDLIAMSKGLDAISNSFNAEVKLAKTVIEMRATGANIGDVCEIGTLRIDGSRKKSS